MISKDKIEKFLAFTLAEVLITMIVIALMTLASIPVIKHSKEYREAAKDKNTWIAFYDQNDKLHVYVDGEPKDDLVVGSGKDQYAKFIPPEGVTRFNVTVIGGGGGGAAGEAGIGQVKNFFPTDNFEQVFVPASDGIYQIVAIGGGGGGGGGASLCEGTGGRSGGAIVQRATLKKGEVYNVTVGIGAPGGLKKNFMESFGQAFMPIGIIAYTALSVITAGGLAIATGWIVAAWGVAATGAISAGLSVNDRHQGGGNGAPSAFMGPGVEIVAAGGGGGEHRRKAGFWPRCRSAGGCNGENVNCGNFGNAGKLGDQFATHSSGSSLYGSHVYKQTAVGWSGRNPGKICTDDHNCQQGVDLGTLMGDMPVSQFGAGGRGGGRLSKGADGQAGIVQVQELPVFGGGAGSPGAISFYSYTKSPLAEGEEYVEVRPGLGGAGGAESGAAGEDGMFSRFGKRIIADGGMGGQPRATNPAENAENEIEATGKDGIIGAITADLKEKLKYPDGVHLIEDVISGGLNHNESCSAKPDGASESAHGKYDGFGQGSCMSNYFLIPGSSGAGGGAKGAKDLSGTPVWGYGGKGASGVVIVTW